MTTDAKGGERSVEWAGGTRGEAAWPSAGAGDACAAAAIGAGAGAGAGACAGAATAGASGGAGAECPLCRARVTAEVDEEVQAGAEVGWEEVATPRAASGDE